MSIIRIDHVTTSCGPGPSLDAGATRALLVEARSGLVLALTVLAISFPSYAAVQRRTSWCLPSPLSSPSCR